MSNLLQVKTNFTAGCIGRNLYGRGDLSIFENGARTLENVIIHPTGGVSRRRGLAYIDRIDRKARLIPFEFNTEQTYLICICADEVRVYRDGACIKTLPSPWREEHLNSLNYTQSADTLLVVHPDVSPRQITRGDNEDWKIGEWEYYTKDGRVFCPFYNYYNHKAKISPGGTGGTITVTSSSKVFVPASVGSLINVRGGQIKISEYVSASEVKAVVNKGLSSTGETVDWEESAFSPQRGWPNSVTFHQNRLVVGGSKSLPNRLWFSKSADLFNFDIGTGLDDEAIEFGILSDQVNVIKAVVSARHLLVFTTGAEWMVSGNPLTPTSIQLSRQTSTGSVRSRRQRQMCIRDRYRTGLPVQRFDADVRRYRKLSGRQRFQPGRMRFVHSVGGRYGFLSDDLSYRGGYGLEQVENGGKLSIRRRHRQRDLFLRQTRRSLFYRKNEQRLLCRLRREAQFRNAEKGVVGTGQFGRI